MAKDVPYYHLEAMPDGSTSSHLYRPKLATTLAEGYGWEPLRHDAMAGLTVAILALPLSMAIAVASGVSPAQGLYTAIIGGFLAAMLDDTMGPAMFIYGEGRVFTTTIDMHVSYLAPARPGPLYGEGQVVQAGKSIAFLEGKLMDLSGVVVARATASARLVPTGKALGAAA